MKLPDKKGMDECLRYFKSRPVYADLFRKVRKKYEGLGHLGGTVTLTRLTEKDKEQLGGFFQKDYHENRTITISSALMLKALEKSKFSAFSWEEILEAYYGEPLSTRKELQQKEDALKREFFFSIMNSADERGGKWMQEVLESKENGWQIFQQQYSENPALLKSALVNTCKVISLLPVWSHQTERLAVFAAKVTGDPHYFDEGTLGERLLNAYLLSEFPEEEITGTRAERKSGLLYRAGILKDDVSNFVLTYGILGTDRAGKKHEGMDGFSRCRQPLILTLHTISRLWVARSQSSAAGEIYVVENPSVFSTLIQTNPYMSAICTNGQPRLAALALMDLLKNENIFYYAGDFDPEGLLIAQNLKLRYQDRLRLWAYREEYYQNALSDVKLSEQRRKKLEGIRVSELQEIKAAMQKEKKAAYQENMIEVYQSLFNGQKK